MPAVEPTKSASRQHVGRALGMREHDDAGMPLADTLESRSPVKRSWTSQCPSQVMISTSVLARDVLREILVGKQDDARRAERFDDLDRVGRRAADVGFGFHRRPTC